MKCVVGADHAGFRLKEQVKEWLGAWGHDVEDLGTRSTDSVDYPDFGAAVGRRVVEVETSGAPVLGFAICGSGIGISIAANKVHGVRAAVVGEPTAAKLSRLHNNANVLCLGERLIGVAVAEACVRAFLETAFEGGRHAGRVAKLGALES